VTGYIQYYKKNFFVPLNEELEGTLHPQKFWCTPKNEGKRVHVPPDEKTCGHAVYMQEIKQLDAFCLEMNRILKINLNLYSVPIIILYITCHTLFLYRTECMITYSHDH
jgi:hypothetical protein